jgi:hypothetical protein
LRTGVYAHLCHLTGDDLVKAREAELDGFLHRGDRSLCIDNAAGDAFARQPHNVVDRSQDVAFNLRISEVRVDGPQQSGS